MKTSAVSVSQWRRPACRISAERTRKESICVTFVSYPVRSPRKWPALRQICLKSSIRARPACVLGLATGSTPLPLYRELIAREQGGKNRLFARAFGKSGRVQRVSAQPAAELPPLHAGRSVSTIFPSSPKIPSSRTVWQPTSLPCAKLMSIRSSVLGRRGHSAARSRPRRAYRL